MEALDVVRAAMQLSHRLTDTCSTLKTEWLRSVAQRHALAIVAYSIRGSALFDRLSPASLLFSELLGCSETFFFPLERQAVFEHRSNLDLQVQSAKVDSFPSGSRGAVRAHTTS